ncbi:transposase [Beggiatoa sp. PS]|nr:transposase [Beggiatoa sp. PS]
MFSYNRCDGLGCQKKIAKTIVEQEADYLLAVKDNQPTLHQAIRNYFEEANKARFAGYNIDYDEKINKGPGRLEQRRCWVGYEIPDTINSQNWAKLETIVMVEFFPNNQ